MTTGEDHRGEPSQSAASSSAPTPPLQVSSPDQAHMLSPASTVLFSPDTLASRSKSAASPRGRRGRPHAPFSQLDRQESQLVVGTGGPALLSFVGKRGATLPSAPARDWEDGVTSATLRTSHPLKERGRSHSRDGGPSRSRSRPARRSTGDAEGVSTPASEPDGHRPPTRIDSMRAAFARNRRHSSSQDHHASGAGTPAVLGEEGASTPAGPDGHKGPAQAAKALASKLAPTRLADLHISRPGLSILPTVHFPGQGSGKESEFLQEAPIWSRLPWKWLYLAYFGLSVGLVFLPWFALTSIPPQWRARSTWTWKRSTLVRLFRHGTRLTFRTHTSLSRDTSKAVPHSKTLRCKFVWIDATPEADIRGELKRAMTSQRIPSTRTCGFWYGEPLKEEDAKEQPAEQAPREPVTPGSYGLSTLGVGRRAGVDEKVVYHLHGGAYWIGTAHENDVTAAVNTEVLRYLAQLYENGESKATLANRCTRSLSLDYRLSVPGRPDIGSYPAALLDAVAGYIYLVRTCGFKESNIIVAGDSAGGNLALALCRYLQDEKVAGVPGSLLLLSPWGDISRSHAGPLTSPNLFATTYTNRDADIISTSVAFRNTAVSAFMGNLPASEAYHNPYLSSCSLQLAHERGGDGPDWGFEGLPRRTYLATGSAEISNDQHLTLAHRMAAGSKRRVPIYTGDRLSEGADVYEMAARLQYPRPDTHQVTLWPSAVGTPNVEGSQANNVQIASPQFASFQEGGTLEKQEKQGETSSSTPVREKGRLLHPEDETSQGNGTVAGVPQDPTSPVAGNDRTSSAMTRISDDQSSPKDDSANAADGVKAADYAPTPSPTSAPPRRPVNARQGTSRRSTRRPDVVPLSLGAAFARAQSQSQFTTPAQTPGLAPPLPATPLVGTPFESGFYFAGDHQPAGAETEVPGSGLRNGFGPQSDGGSADEDQATEQAGAGHETEGEGEAEQEYFAMGGEDRTVHLDEVRDAVHDFLLFPWHEPERGQCWRRIAKWIDEA